MAKKTKSQIDRKRAQASDEKLKRVAQSIEDILKEENCKIQPFLDRQVRGDIANIRLIDLDIYGEQIPKEE